MKILMLGWELPPHNSGGLGVACYQLCKDLALQGAEIEFVLPYTLDEPIDFMKVTSSAVESGQSFLQRNETYGGHQLFETSAGISSWSSGVTYGEYEQVVRQLAVTQQFDVVHAHDWLVFRAALEAKRVSKLPLIVHIHSIESDRAGVEGGGNPFIRDAEATGMMLADRIIAISQRTKAAIVREYGIPADKIEVLHNGIDRSELPVLDESNAYPYLQHLREQGYRIVTNIGRLTLQKGIPNLLRAAQQVIQYSPKTVFLIVGDGEQKYELIQLSADLGILPNVIFTGFQRGKAWRDAYSIADLFVMPSVSEPFGLTPIEALHYHVPSLISYQSGVSEVLHNCLKVDFWDIQEMANQIVSFLENASLRTTLLENANNELQHLNWRSTSQRIIEMYGEHMVRKVAA